MKKFTSLFAVLAAAGTWFPAAAQKAPHPPLYHQWFYRCDGSIQATPAIHQGVLFFGSMDGFLHAVENSTGKPRWRAELGGMTLSTPLVDAKRNQVVIGCDDGHLYSFSLADGKPRWKHRLKGEWTVMAGPQVRGGPFRVGDTLIAVNQLGYVEAVRAQDGKTVWEAKGFGLTSGGAALAEDRLLFTSTERGLICLDARTGQVAWERRDVGRSVSTPAIAGNQVFVGSSNGHVFALDLATGKDLWRRSLGGTGRFAGQVVGAPLVLDESVLVADIDGRLFGLERKTGAILWRGQTESAFWAGGRRSGSHAWFASTGGHLVGLDLDRPAEARWLLDLKAPLWTAPLVHKDKLFLGTDDGYLLCLSGTKPSNDVTRPPVQTNLRFKHPAPRRGELLPEFIGTASGFKSQPFGGPPRESDLRGKQLHFTFQLKLERAGKGPDGKDIAPGQEIQVVSRPLTNYFDWNCSPTFTGLPLDWSKNPRLRVVGSYEPPVLNPFADGKTQPRPLCAYLIQTEPKSVPMGKGKVEDASLAPPYHWPTWYVNNWVHFLCDIYEVGHDRYFANTGHVNWGWDYVEERTMGQFLPRDVWAKVKPRYYLWRAVNGLRQVKDPRTGILRGVPTTLTIYLSGAHHDDPYHSEKDLRAPPPKVALHAAKRKGPAPLTVKFRADLPKEDKAILWVQWTFDSAKGLTVDSVEREPTFTYRQPGTYLVSLTAVSAAGTVSHVHTRIEVQKK